MKFLLKNVKVPGGWRTTLGVLLGLSLVGVAAGYGVTVLIVWGASVAVLAILGVAYLLSGFFRL